MQLTRQHFRLIADTIRELPPRPTQEEVAVAFSRRLRVTNPNFDRERFLEACDPLPPSDG